MAGSSAALVVHGEPGIGKTALLEESLSSQTSCDVMTISGVESEMELAWAALHQLCTPMLGYLPRLPAPQVQALQAAFGVADRGRADPFLCGLAVLGLLTETSEERPIICMIDDAYALDRASLRTLGFVSRRLQAESVGLLFATREIPQELAGVPTLHVQGLADADATALLGAATRTRLDPAVRTRLIAETSGNPLAIIQLAKRRHLERLAGGYRVPLAEPLAGQIESSFLETARRLDRGAQRLLLLASAEPTGDVALLRRAALASGLEPSDNGDATLRSLITLEPSVRFRHPLVRSAIYGAASDEDRRAAHRALADPFAPGDDPDRRIWHLAQSLAGLDEETAAALERSATGAQARGGWAAAAAFLERAAQLTPDRATRARRELAAAGARFQLGDAAGAISLLDTAEVRGLDGPLPAHAQLLRAQITAYLTRGGDAPTLMLAAARALAPFDLLRSHNAYLGALIAGMLAGPLAVGEDIHSVASAILAEVAAGHPPSPGDLLLNAAAQLAAHGAAKATPAVRTATRTLLASPGPANPMHLWIAANLAMHTFDEKSVVLSAQALENARHSGLLPLFVLAAVMHGGNLILSGDLAGANALYREAIAVAEDIDAPPPRWVLLALHAYRGERDEFTELAARVTEAATRSNEGHLLVFTHANAARLDVGLRRYRDALAHCHQALAAGLFIHEWFYAIDYAEAAARAGTEAEITAAREYLMRLTDAADTSWGRGLRAVGRALLDDAADTEPLYRASTAEFGDTAVLSLLGRVTLLFGEWLRHEGRHRESRAQLRRALDLLTSCGYTAFAARATHELARLGEKSRRRPPALDDQLSPQELQVAQLAIEGLSNREIGQRLYLSHRTVASHLYRIYPKLGVSSRGQLHLALGTSARSAQAAEPPPTSRDPGWVPVRTVSPAGLCGRSGGAR